MAGVRFGLLVAAALALSVSGVAAQDTGKPCAGDIKTLCAGVQPGEGRLKACIKAHLTELSPACEARVFSVAVAGKACKADLAKLCGGVVPGTGAVRACMKSHIAEAGDTCRDAMSRVASGTKLFGRGDL